jgi:hypothetical protein
MKKLKRELKKKWVHHIDDSSCPNEEDTFTDIKVGEDDFYEHPPSREFVFIQLYNFEDDLVLTLSFCKFKTYFVIQIIKNIVG